MMEDSNNFHFFLFHPLLTLMEPLGAFLKGLFTFLSSNLLHKDHLFLFQGSVLIFSILANAS